MVKGETIIYTDTAEQELKVAKMYAQAPELIYHDAPKTEKSGCPYCENEEVKWAELMGDTYWKQCNACGMIYVGHDALQEEIDNEVSLSV